MTTKVSLTKEDRKGFPFRSFYGRLYRSFPFGSPKSHKAKETCQKQGQATKDLFHLFGFDGDHKFAAKIQKKELRGHHVSKVCKVASNKQKLFNCIYNIFDDKKIYQKRDK